MRNYIHEWIHGVEKDENMPISARVSTQIVKNLDEISAEFGVNRSSVIEAALDYGARYLLEEVQRMNESNIEMVGRMAKEQNKEEEFKAMIKGGKKDA